MAELGEAGRVVANDGGVELAYCAPSRLQMAFSQCAQQWHVICSRDYKVTIQPALGQRSSSRACAAHPIWMSRHVSRYLPQVNANHRTAPYRQQHFVPNGTGAYFMRSHKGIQSHQSETPVHQALG